MRAELQDGDVTINSGYVASRAEVYGRTPQYMRTTPQTDWPDPVGSTRWYSISVRLANNWTLASDSTWLVLTQWKGRDGGSPPVALELRKDRMLLGGTRSLDGAYADPTSAPRREARGRGSSSASASRPTRRAG